jgi:hypothetical protein
MKGMNRRAGLGVTVGPRFSKLHDKVPFAGNSITTNTDHPGPRMTIQSKRLRGWIWLCSSQLSQLVQNLLGRLVLSFLLGSSFSIFNDILRPR